MKIPGRSFRIVSPRLAIPRRYDFFDQSLELQLKITAKEQALSTR